MKHIKAMLLGAAIITGATTFAGAQAVVPVQWGWGQRDSDDRQAFKEGFQQGQWDARHNRRFDSNNNRWRERDDREAYRNGYQRGFRQDRHLRASGRQQKSHASPHGFLLIAVCASAFTRRSCA